MSDSHPALTIASDSSATTPGSRRRDGNAADVHYLEEARDALGPIMAASRVIATSGRSHHVRALARLALAEQAEQLAAITTVLSAWGRLDATGTGTPLADAVTGLRSTDQDRLFVDQLSDHAHASLASARVQMITGASRTARSIAEHAIHAHDRRLAALTLLLPTATAQSSDAVLPATVSSGWPPHAAVVASPRPDLTGEEVARTTSDRRVPRDARAVPDRSQ